LLNIGTDSLVFFDDNPAERALVVQSEPDVWVVDVPDDPALFVRALDMTFAFEWPELTQEDVGRATSYIDNRKRQELEISSGDYGTYLGSLEMKIDIARTDLTSLTRVCQLINKTNQFNLRTKRYSEDELAYMIKSPDYELLHVRLSDRFSNYGIIASVIMRYYEDVAFIENWVMSCRVFKRGVEDATYNALVAAARARGSLSLAAQYSPTPKNGFVADLPAQFGWIRCHQSSNLPFLFETSTKDVFYLTDLTIITPRSHLIKMAL